MKPRSIARVWFTSWGSRNFADDGQVRGLVRTLEGPSLAGIVATAAQPLEIGGVQVLIGGEGRWQEFSDLALGAFPLWR